MKFRRQQSYHFSPCVAASPALWVLTLGSMRKAGMLLAALLLLVTSPVTHGKFKLASPQFLGEIDVETLQSRFVSSDSLQITVKKLVHEGSLVNVSLDITNLSDSRVDMETLNILIGLDLQSEQDEKAGIGASYYSYLDPFLASMETNAAERLDEEIISEGTSLIAGDWFGWTSRYHFEAIRVSKCVPACSLAVIINGAETASIQETTFVQETASSQETASGKETSMTPQNIAVQLTPLDKSLAPGESFTISFDLIAAAKSRALLQDPEVNLESLLLYNLWDWLRHLSFIIWDLLDYLFVATGNWGVSIILLALIVRIVFIPITRFSLNHQKRAIQQQADIAPLLEAVKRDYKGVEQSEKILALYESQKYDQLAPFKSMAGLFIQIPIFVALFNVLGDAWKVSGHSFLWIPDLARSDRLFDWGVNIYYFGSYFNLLPVLMAAVTIVSTWLAGRQAGKKDVPTMTLFGMGGLFFVLFYSFPAALVLYWMSSNFFQLIQQSIENWLQVREQSTSSELGA